MSIGLYGLHYLEVARVPERGWLLAFAGLLGMIILVRYFFASNHLYREGVRTYWNGRFDCEWSVAC